MARTLITGATGQIGSEFVEVLRGRHGADSVVELDLERPPERDGEASMEGPFVEADVRDEAMMAEVVSTYDVEIVFHLASLLSATGEDHPDQAWDVNLGGLKNVLDLARKQDLRVFWPSSIAVFGPSTPKENTPQQTVLDPTSIYGVTKRSGELLCRYYHRRFDVDVRSLRFPGLISYKTAPGGGTTDYAVDMYVRAARGQDYACFLQSDTRLPMMYMPDALRATLALMEADAEALSVRDSYNVAAFSFTPEDLVAAIRRHVPNFACTYDPDDRQKIADNWPASIDDSTARSDWGWTHKYDLEAMTEDMMDHLREGQTVRG